MSSKSPELRHRILLVTNVFPPQIGGPATFISTVARRLVKEHGHRVTVVCSSDQPSDSMDASQPYAIKRLHHRSALQYHVTMRWTLVTQLLRNEITLVNGMENAACPIARTLGKRYVLKVPGDNVWQMARNNGVTTLDIDAFQSDAAMQARYSRAVERRNRIAQEACLVVTPSKYLERMVLGWGVGQNRVTTIPNGVDLDRFTNHARGRLPGEPLRVLFVGRLTNWKGVETILLALRELKNVVLTVVGDGLASNSLQELSRQIGLSDRATFTGRLSAEEVVSVMAESHVLVLTSLYEGMSHTLQEAMAAGLPCIASNRGGNDEVITDGHDGLLIEPQNVSALVGALSRLEGDEATRTSIAVQARRTASKFSMDATTTAFANLLTRLVTGE